MSLLKAYRGDYYVRHFAHIKADFEMVLGNHTEEDRPLTKDDLISLVSFYAEYAVAYLVVVSETLEEPKGVSDTMKFMNSLIAEVAHEVGLHYYHKEGAFSIIDKAVQLALANGGCVDAFGVETAFDEIEESWVEEEIEIPEESEEE